LAGPAVRPAEPTKNNRRKPEEEWEMRDSNLALNAAKTAGVLGCGLLALVSASGSAATTPQESDAGAYTWSAELVAFDDATNTATMRSWVVDPADARAAKLEAGDAAMLTWSGITQAAGVRAIEPGDDSSYDRMTMPVEFVSFDLDGRYVSFKVAVPEADAAAIARLEPGDYVRATSPFVADDGAEAVRSMRPYSDVG
jgi:hypothetical protein